MPKLTRSVPRSKKSSDLNVSDETEMTDTDARFMALAIDEARQGDAPYGAVLVLDNAIVARAHNTTRRDNDPTAHAEINVIRLAKRIDPDVRLDRCTLYTTGEPCPMCAAAAVWAGVSRIVFGASIRDLKRVGQNQIDVPTTEIVTQGFRPIEVRGDVMALSVLALFEISNG